MNSVMTFLVLMMMPPPAATSPKSMDVTQTNHTRDLPVATLTCRELLQANGQERDLLLAMMHGYMAGKRGLQSVDTVEMSFVTDMVIDHCIQAPSDRLVHAFDATEKPAH